MDWMNGLGKENSRMRIYAYNAKRYNRTGRDFILHKAPALVLAISKDELIEAAATTVILPFLMRN